MNVRQSLPLFLFILCAFTFTLCNASLAQQTNSWQHIIDEADGQIVDWYMWGGSPSVNAKDKSTTMVVTNFLLSPEVQLEKAKSAVWGNFPVISPHKLPSEILVYLEKGWQNHVLKDR